MFSLHYYSFFIVDLEDNAQKMKFSIKDFFSKCDQIRSFVQIWSHLLEKSLMENLILVKWESQKSIKVFIIDWMIHYVLHIEFEHPFCLQGLRFIYLQEFALHHHHQIFAGGMAMVNSTFLRLPHILRCEKLNT